MMCQILGKGQVMCNTQLFRCMIGEKSHEQSRRGCPHMGNFLFTLYLVNDQHKCAINFSRTVRQSYWDGGGGVRWYCDVQIKSDHMYLYR
jgi:hypothetical protein